MKVLKRAVELSHDILKRVVLEGDTVADCTAGNGNDTVFLAGLTGKSGKVYSFDIQQRAIINTKEKLLQSNLTDRVELILDSHENIDLYVKSGIKAAMYNLGYLPGGDHSIVTETNSTVNSIRKVLDILQVGGIVTIAIYYGHEGGLEEKYAVLNYVSNLPQQHFAVQKTEFINLVNYPPILMCIEKLEYTR